MSAPEAWLLTLRSGHLAAIGARELVHVLAERSVLHPVPAAPAQSRHAVVFDGAALPVLDLGVLLGAGEASPDGPGCLAIVGYRADSPAQTSFAALLLAAVPARQRLDDSCRPAAATDLDPALARLAHSAFTGARGTVAVLDLVHLLAPRPESQRTRA